MHTQQRVWLWDGCGNDNAAGFCHLCARSRSCCCPIFFLFPPCIPSVHLCAGFSQSADDVARQARTAPPQTPNTNQHQTPNTKPQTPNPMHETLPIPSVHPVQDRLLHMAMLLGPPLTWCLCLPLRVAVNVARVGACTLLSRCSRFRFCSLMRSRFVQWTTSGCKCRTQIGFNFFIPLTSKNNTEIGFNFIFHP